ncbi:MAG: hypothetical protein AAFV29_15495 [Myxococcota bacterium]
MIWRSWLVSTMTSVILLIAGACSQADVPSARTRAVGDRLRPFISVDTVSGKRYCQVCAYGGKPTLMVVLDLDDPKANETLHEMQAILAQYPRLTAFALFGSFDGQTLRAPLKPIVTQAALADRARALGLTFPVTFLPAQLTPGEALHYQPFVDRFDVRQSQTALLAAADNRIRFAGQLDSPHHQTRLKRAVKALF